MSTVSKFSLEIYELIINGLDDDDDLLGYRALLPVFSSDDRHGIPAEPGVSLVVTYTIHCPSSMTLCSPFVSADVLLSVILCDRPCLGTLVTVAALIYQLGSFLTSVLSSTRSNHMNHFSNPLAEPATSVVAKMAT